MRLRGFSNPPFRTIALIPAPDQGDRHLKSVWARTEFLCNDHFDRSDSRYRLLFPDRGSVAAEREERRPGCGFRRSGQPDSVWPAGRGFCSLPGDDLVRHHFHAHVDHAFDFCRAADGAHVRALRSETFANEVAANYAGAFSTADGSAESGTDTEITYWWERRASPPGWIRGFLHRLPHPALTEPGRDSHPFPLLWLFAGRVLESRWFHRGG